MGENTICALTGVFELMNATNNPVVFSICRRRLLQAAATLTAGLISGAFAQTPSSAVSGKLYPDLATLAGNRSARDIASETHYWEAVRSLYDVPDQFVHLEHGNWGMMTNAVREHYLQQVTRVNQLTSYYGRTRYGSALSEIMQALADTLGVDVDELAPVRNATESLTALIGGYNKLRPGDAVLYADLDYASMQGAMRELQHRRGVSVETISLPEPASREALIDSYRSAFQRNPRIKMVLLTHISHRTGLLLPVAELVSLARQHDVDVILDSAHAWGQVDFTLPDTGADFVGLNLHKWIGAPLGLGLLYIRRDRLADIDRHAVRGGGSDLGGGIASRTGIGTNNIAAILSVPQALQAHRDIGPLRKEMRLRHLRNLWVDRLSANPKIQILTPDDESLYAGITSFRVRGNTGVQENQRLAERLMLEHGIFTVYRTGLASGACVRVTPAVFSRDEEMIALADAVETIIG